MRLGALTHADVTYVFTHDSLALGEDGPTHQPVEQLANLRAVPGLVVVRPADANEVTAAWRVAIEMRDRPVALVLSRQNLPVIDRSGLGAAMGLRHGAYVLAEAASLPPDVMIIATGSEVHLALSARERLEAQGVRTRVVSMPSWELFEEEEPEYRESVLPEAVEARLAVEAGSPQGWHRWVGCKGDVIGVSTFGASAPGPTVLERYGFSVDNITSRALAVIERCRRTAGRDRV
jgi:transketolase